MALSWVIPLASLVASMGAIFAGYLYSHRSGQALQLTDIDLHLRVQREQLVSLQTQLADVNHQNEILRSENLELLRKVVALGGTNGKEKA